MADRTRSQKREQRSSARMERRSLAAKPFEELDEAAAAEEDAGEPRSTLKHAVATALGGIVAAGVAGAARALAERRAESAEAKPEPEEQPEPEPEPEAAESEPEPQASADDEEREEPQPEISDDDEGDETDHAPRGASAGEIKEVVEEAKRQLEELLGAEPERVRGFERSNGGWRVTLEVVSLRRVPETTDVLSLYEVEFDEERKLAGVTETRRYRRSQIEEGS